MYRVAFLSFAFIITCTARDIVFPAVAGIADTRTQSPIGLTETVDIVTGSQFSGLTTFAHLPYVNCFVDNQVENDTYDIAFLGAPFDTVGFPGFNSFCGFSQASTRSGSIESV